MLKCHALMLSAGMMAAGLWGCAPSASPPVTSRPAPDAKYVLSTEPSGAVGVGAAREAAKDDDEVILVGRIGGSQKPFIDGVAAFTIVDPKVPHCSKKEGCRTPWDYCCEQNEVKKNIAMVKFVDEGQKTITTDARQLLGVKELTTIVVHGKAQRDAEGNLTVLADQVFVKE